MTNTKNLALLGCIALSVAACSPSGSDNKEGTTTLSSDTAITTVSKDQAKNDSSRLQPAETGFIQQAAIGGLMEVEMGNLTTQKSKSPKILAFARRMIADHTAANKELQEIAQGLGVKVPEALPSEEQSHLAAMRQAQANEYDQSYMDMMVKDHAKTVDLFNSASKFKNEKLRAFALKTLPVLQQHNNMAIGIDSVIRVKKPDNRGDDLPNVDKKHKN
jgi:putative membrane protein